MNVRYAAGETTYQEDPVTGRYVEVRYMETRSLPVVSNGKQNCVNLLIVAGTDVNFPDSLGLTPLMHAVCVRPTCHSNSTPVQRSRC